VVGAAASAAASMPTWLWPLPAPHALARPYVAPESPYGSGHRGLDIVATHSAAELSVTAPARGVVHFVGFVVDRPVVSIDHGGGVLSSFEPVASTLTRGDQVLAGQVIGTLQRGHCSQPCLHLGARVGGEYVSPLLFLGGMPRAVLLPTRVLPG
jgi:murein DD-endopeptidase MepM/ murein hydrolase activator NlpD